MNVKVDMLIYYALSESECKKSYSIIYFSVAAYIKMLLD